MDNAAYTIERAKLKTLERLREKAMKDQEHDWAFDLSVEIRRSNMKIQQLLQRRFA